MQVLQDLRSAALADARTRLALVCLLSAQVLAWGRAVQWTRGRDRPFPTWERGRSTPPSYCTQAGGVVLAVMLAVTLTCPSLLHPSKCHRTELTDTVLSTRKTRLDTGVLQ